MEDEPLLPRDDADDDGHPEPGSVSTMTGAMVCLENLQLLLDGMPVLCESCDSRTDYKIQRKSLSFAVTWVS